MCAAIGVIINDDDDDQWILSEIKVVYVTVLVVLSKS